MITIYKYPLKISEKEHAVTLTKDCLFLAFGSQAEDIFLWAETDTNGSVENWKYVVLPTGGDVGRLTARAAHRGSIITASGLVWHVYMWLA